MPRFQPSTWVQQTNTNLAGGSVRNGYLSKFLDERIFVTSSIQFTGGNPNWAVNDFCLSSNRMSSWTRFDANSSHEQVIYSFHAMERPDGSVRYARLRYQFGRSFFVANDEIPAGFIAVDTSEHGGDWTERQQLYTWQHFPSTGGAGQANHTIDALFAFMPGSGPGGADADWLLVRGLVQSGQGVKLNVFQWWRSDNFGDSWVFVRDATSGPFTSFPSAFAVGGVNNGSRLLAYSGTGLAYSTNFGVTWTGTGGLLTGVPQYIIEQAGFTWAFLLPGTLTGAGNVGVSCDNGVTAVGTQAGMGTTNANWGAVRLSPCEILGTITGGVGVGQIIFYSDNGGETYVSQGADVRMNPFQAGNPFVGLFRDGAPFVIGVDAKTFISSGRATGSPSQRTSCPLAFAGLKKAGIPPNCGHPMLTRCD